MGGFDYGGIGVGGVQVMHRIDVYMKRNWRVHDILHVDYILPLFYLYRIFQHESYLGK